MKYLLSRRAPGGSRILLVESGSRELIERILPHIQSTWGARMPIELVTCYAGRPAGLAESAVVWRVADYTTPEARRRLIDDLRSRDYAYAGIICAAEPVMTKWKWLIAARVPAKFFILNENADYFWLDRENAKVARRFFLVRAGLSGAGSLRAIGRLLLFPFTLLFLITYAFVAHARRWLRMALRHSS
ncbi:MAG TPA: hypothetical protein VG345_10110 [Bryobacteraceae bacterium]|jgi:hypothetical protein|nr:hypothetical protein [Bryobacteraceae bacterium]